MLRRITEHVDPGLPRLVRLQPALELQPLTQTSFPTVKIGRHPDCNFVLTSAGIPLLLSRQHAEITFDGEQFVLSDLDTTNGTYVRAPASRRARRGPGWARRAQGLRVRVRV
jgi:predicted component of type VI protein secretion system